MTLLKAVKPTLREICPLLRPRHEILLEALHSPLQLAHLMAQLLGFRTANGRLRSRRLAGLPLRRRKDLVLNADRADRGCGIRCMCAPGRKDGPVVIECALADASVPCKLGEHSAAVGTSGTPGYQPAIQRTNE